MTIGGGKGLFVLAGPCVIEDYDRTLAIGKEAKAICERLGIPMYLRLLLIKLIALASILSVVQA